MARLKSKKYSLKHRLNEEFDFNNISYDINSRRPNRPSTRRISGDKNWSSTAGRIHDLGDGTFNHDLKSDPWSSTATSDARTRAIKSFSAMLGTENELYVMQWLRNQGLKAQAVGGTDNPDVQFIASDGQRYNIEVGATGKGLQCGYSQGAKYLPTTKSHHLKRQAALGNTPDGVKTKEQIADCWKSTAEDKAMGDQFVARVVGDVDGGKYVQIYALSEEAASVDFEGGYCNVLMPEDISNTQLVSAGSADGTKVRLGPNFNGIYWDAASLFPIDNVQIDWANRSTYKRDPSF